MDTATKILFFGTSSIAVPALRALVNDERFEVVGVVTQPDRPIGRKGEMQSPPVKLAAEALHVPVFQFESVKSEEAYLSLSVTGFQAAVVVSFGQIIPQTVLDLAPNKFINIHASILPKYRGSCPINMAIANGDTETGVSLMVLDAKMDHGPIISIETTPITKNDDAISLGERVAEIGANLLIRDLQDYLKGVIPAKEQDHEQATVVSMLKREDGYLDPKTMTAEEMERRIRAFRPWPGTSIALADGKRLKILEAELREFKDDSLPCLIGKDQKILALKTVQPEGKNAMNGEDFLRGYKGEL
ncbi:MAG: methionyl-tRNA formyltransferase [Candidatus Magasanikbacteria bacterium]|nr:methionyl-tRNA formyltransferase [Candidatus Magasanikbacteria bacterium]MCA9391458.1 methionyl-tRNA formyltransferase [Candidatus Magasanikbacteria bacterium]USN52045.1 MAG: methionyl-tRNA formyltransferase [Candidatus Nomurabacteria bacterium]